MCTFRRIAVHILKVVKENTAKTLIQNNEMFSILIIREFSFEGDTHYIIWSTIPPVSYLKRVGNRNRKQKINRNKKVPQSWPKQLPPLFLFLWNVPETERITETETETVFKGVGWQLEKILEQILFLLVSVSNSYEVVSWDVPNENKNDIPGFFYFLPSKSHFFNSVKKWANYIQYKQKHWLLKMFFPPAWLKTLVGFRGRKNIVSVT